MTRPDAVTRGARSIVVAIEAARVERVAEALRAAVGLGLRGDSVTVVVLDAARAAAASDHPGVRRALATLPVLGHAVIHDPAPARLGALVRTADAVEVWT